MASIPQDIQTTLIREANRDPRVAEGKVREGPGDNSYLGKYYTRLRIGKYQRPKPFGTPEFNPSIVVFLPIPNELRDDTSVGYTNVNLETVGDLINNGLTGAGGAAVLRFAGQGIATAGGAAATALGAAAGAAMKNNAVESMITGAIRGAGSTLFNAEQISSALQQQVGLAPNPNPSVQFQGPILRDFSYTWAFYPKTKEESQDIQKLIKILKRSALPRNSIQQSAAVLDYPDMCQINFYPWDSNGSGPWGWSDNSIIKYKKCVMQNVNVNYNPFGTPAFFEGTNLPVSYQLTISFKEIEYMLSDDWGKDIADVPGVANSNLTDIGVLSAVAGAAATTFITPFANAAIQAANTAVNAALPTLSVVTAATNPALAPFILAAQAAGAFPPSPTESPSTQ